MKTVFYSLLLLFIVSISACKKDETDKSAYLCSSPCQECTKGLTVLTVCRAGSDTDAEYEANIAAQEAGGANCIPSDPSTTDLVDADGKAALESEGYECVKQ